MTTDQLKAWLDAHGVPGAPPPDNRWCGIDYDGGTVGIIKACPATLALQPYDILRHAPLPDVLGLLAEVEALRGRKPEMCGCVSVRDVGFYESAYVVRADKECADCGGSGAVLVSP